MKKLIKICAIAGLAFLLTGIGVVSAAAAMGGTAGGIRQGVNRAVRYAAGRHGGEWEREWDDAWDEVWDEAWDHTHWDDDFWEDHEWDHNGRESAGGSGQDSAPSGPDTSSGSHHPESGNPSGLGNPQGSDGQNTGAPAAERTDDGVWSIVGARKLDLEVDKGSVRLVTSADVDTIQVKVEDPAGKTYCYMEEDTLKIERKDKNSRKEAKIQVTVPEGYVFDKVDLSMGAAACQAQGIVTRKLELEAGVGDMDFYGQVDGNVEVETGVGHVQLKLAGSMREYNYKIECGIGAVEIAGEQYGRPGVDKKIDNGASKSIELECGVGDITIDFIDSL